MRRYGLMIGVVAIGVLVAGFLAMILFGNIWAKYGLGGAILVVGGGMLLFAWLMDRKAKKQREGLGRV